MAVNRLYINDFLSRMPEGLLIDVRSPGEYNHARIPGALSLPLFTDEERKEVGTAYKQQSRETAIKIGLGFFGPRMRKMVEEVEAMIDGRWPMAGNSYEHHAPTNDQQPTSPIFDAAAIGQRPTANVYLYCWRGGMRSGAVAWLLDLYGFRVNTLAGGYKSFRNKVLQTFTEPVELKVLGGYTGSGKTEMLAELARLGEAVIDLERIASHKGSAFGNIKMPPQPTQEQFENELAMELLRLRGSGPIWVEDESQRIGDRNIPNALFDQMEKAPVFFLDVPFEARLEHLVEEYGNTPTERLALGVQRISKRLGGADAKNALSALEMGNIPDCFRILLHYYDKLYLKGLKKRQDLPAQLTNIECSGIDTKDAGLLLQKHLVP